MIELVSLRVVVFIKDLMGSFVVETTSSGTINSTILKGVRHVDFLSIGVSVRGRLVTRVSPILKVLFAGVV